MSFIAVVYNKKFTDYIIASWQSWKSDGDTSSYLDWRNKKNTINEHICWKGCWSILWFSKLEYKGQGGGMSLYGRYARRALVQNANMHTLFTEQWTGSSLHWVWAPVSSIPSQSIKDVLIGEISGFICGYSNLKLNPYLLSPLYMIWQYLYTSMKSWGQSTVVFDSMKGQTQTEYESSLCQRGLRVSILQ